MCLRARHAAGALAQAPARSRPTRAPGVSPGTGGSLAADSASPATPALAAAIASWFASLACPGAVSATPRGTGARRSFARKHGRDASVSRLSRAAGAGWADAHPSLATAEEQNTMEPSFCFIIGRAMLLLALVSGDAADARLRSGQGDGARRDLTAAAKSWS